MKSQTEIRDMIQELNRLSDESYLEGRGGDGLLFAEASTWLNWVLKD